MRVKAPNTADGHWKLGVWCEQKGLKDLADMEFTIVCQLDPRREAAWKKLGYLKQNGKWTTAAKVAAERAEVEAQRKADAHWRPLIQKWKTGLARKDKRAESEKALAAVTDPRAVPSIWKAFATVGPMTRKWRSTSSVTSKVRGRRGPWPAWRSSVRPT